jgi:DAACS family dicarboxylate/amino acid:cation (Na+ or H+) symporter
MATHWRILMGLLLGVVLGLIINLAWTDQTWASMGVGDPAAFKAHAESSLNDPSAVAHAVRFLARLNRFVGDLFVRLLRFAAVPIVLFSLISGVASLGDPRQLGRVGVKTLVIYLCTAVFAVVLGLGIANVVQPGKHISPESRDALLASGSSEVAARAELSAKVGGIWDQLLAIVPRNPFEAFATGDMMAVIFCAVALGVGLTLMPRERAGPALDACAAIAEAISIGIHIVMRLAPVAVFCLMVPIAAGLGIGAIKALGVFCAAFLAGLSFIMWVEYPLLVWLFGGMRPRFFLRGLAPAHLVAFTSSSSNATLPVTMTCVVERLGVPPRIAGFVLPLGATINMDGTAMYQGMVTLFVAQAFGIELSLGQQVSIVGAATLAAIGSPGIPSGGIVLLIAVLQSVGLPAQGIALILGVDRILDMCRTVVNVSGDAVAAVIVSKGERIAPVEA